MDNPHSVWTTLNQLQKPALMNPPSYNASAQPAPSFSGRSTPSSLQNSAYGFKSPLNEIPRSNNSTPANDSFANLVSFTSHSTDSLRSLKTLSLREQQKALQEKRRREGTLPEKSLDRTFGAHAQDGDFLESLGSGRVTPNRIASPPSYAGTDEYGGQKLSTAINKPFAAIEGTTFQKDGKLRESSISALDTSPQFDSSSGTGIFPSSDGNDKYKGINGSNSRETGHSSVSYNLSGIKDINISNLDDDPFGLGSIANNKNANQYKTATDAAEEDDILGLLGRPVSEFPSQTEREETLTEVVNVEDSGKGDQALAELIDMGFSAEKSREALASTESGTNVQAAVGWLLRQAHSDAQNKSRSSKEQENEGLGNKAAPPNRTSQRSQSPASADPEPAWLRAQNRANIGERQLDSRSPVNGDKDPGKIAAELGTNLLKTANSLWKTGTKKLNQAVSELNSDSDSSQPKWMRDAQQSGIESRSQRSKGRQNRQSSEEEKRAVVQPVALSKPLANVTDEALMLESGHGRPLRKPSRPANGTSAAQNMDLSREPSPVFTKSSDYELSQPRFLQKPRIHDAKARLSRQANEEQASSAYISPARRKKPAAKPPSPEINILLDDTEASIPPVSKTTINPLFKPESRALSQSPAPARKIPQISPSALQSSTNYRLEGTSAFKRGDYALATAHYSSALSTLPSSHPLTIVLLTNRALAHLKTGDPKSSIVDSKSAILNIGPSRGALEMIDLGGTEGSRDMQTFWGKAMTRQAEALEQLERWSDAAAVWKACVEAGFGGGTSTAGRDRCEKAAAGPSSQPPRASRPAVPKKPAPNYIQRTSALDDLTGSASAATVVISTEAVRRLRKANAAAEKLDDEKFALADQVDERLTGWRTGREGNLRALLASLETVLWEGSGWKKVGMGELIIASKVKVVYMRGIGKVHPDKVRFQFALFCFQLFTSKRLELIMDSFSYRLRLQLSRR